MIDSMLQNPMALTLIVFVVGVSYLLWKKHRQKQIVRRICEKYIHVLAKKRAQLLVEDDYGDLDADKWIREARRFFAKKVEPHLDKRWDRWVSGKVIGRIIEDAVVDYQEEHTELFQYDESMGGVEYEHYCAEILRRSGWNATVSTASNDQGVDIFAKKNHLSVAIQCKKYSKPIGNKAVQDRDWETAYLIDQISNLKDLRPRS